MTRQLLDLMTRVLGAALGITSAGARRLHRSTGGDHIRLGQAGAERAADGRLERMEIPQILHSDREPRGSVQRVPMPGHDHAGWIVCERVNQRGQASAIGRCRVVDEGKLIRGEVVTDDHASAARMRNASPSVV